MIVGLTGGIGSGKTTVAAMFHTLGVPVFNSDEEAKLLMHNSLTIKNEIITLLGEEAYQNENLNKEYIANLVFEDADLLEKLNEIVHPAVRESFVSWANIQETPYVIQEAAIIFENGSENLYDRIVLVKAPVKARVQRLLEREGSSEKKIEARMKNQWSDDKKESKAHFVINNIDRSSTELQVKEIHRQLRELTDSSQPTPLC